MSFATGYAMKKRAKKSHPMDMEADCMAEGGEAVASDDEQDADMIARIVSKRREYSKGGMVANDTPPLADSLPADYDDLALRDDLEDDSSAGNEIGDEALDKSDEDVVSKVMSSRKKKDKLPRPA